MLGAYVLTNVHMPPAEGNHRNKFGNMMKRLVMEDYSIHMGYVDRSDQMSANYGMIRRTWKWAKLFSHHTYWSLSVLSSFIGLMGKQ
jgi:hypothetical protein